MTQEYAWKDRSGETRLRGTIDPAPGGASASVTIGNADILTLPTTPLAVIPDVGAGNTYIPTGGMIVITLADDYTNVGVNCTFTLGDQTGTYQSCQYFVATHISDGEAPDVEYLPYPVWAISADGFGVIRRISGGRHRALWLTVQNLDGDSNDLGNFTGGGSANGLTVTAYYAVAALP